MIKNLTFVTGNIAKYQQLRRHLKYLLLHQKLDLGEIQSLDLEEIIEHKAKEAYKQIKQPVLVEDTSLVFQALGKLPGGFSFRKVKDHFRSLCLGFKKFR